MADPFPPDILPAGTSDADAWAIITQRLASDPELAARVANAFSGQPNLDDRYPTPLNPPSAWFEPRNDVPSGMKVTVMPDGAVVGRFFEWGECVMGVSAPGDCWTPPPSPSAYEGFHQSDVNADDGNGGLVRIKAGMLVPGHSDPDASVAASIEHYNDPTKGRVFARAYEDEHGGYIVGALVPWATYADAALVSGSALSGHWAWRENYTTVDGVKASGYDCIGPSMVVRPGLPLRRRTHEPDVITAATGQPVSYTGRLWSDIEIATTAKETGMAKRITIDGVEYAEVVTAHCAGRCGHCETCRGDKPKQDETPNQAEAAAFDSEDVGHALVLTALKEMFGSNVTISDISGSTVKFMAEDVEMSASFFTAEDGSVEIGEVTGQDDAEASVTANNATGTAAIEARLEAMETRQTSLEAMLAESLSQDIEAELLGSGERSDQVEEAEADES